ncbi:MAG: glycosyltransferase [Chroococcus sp. CMT-3BRIN-NPC107]|jgi:glycosyltransferase involved in cell wall biosynthesis|nr:glycosyltransferase [Chroococcus sp. CMT-3BRIN-NPC107]
MNVLVSVIIPAYKADKYIKEALDSVKSQTYKPWEIIVVEDAWQDETENIVKQFAQTEAEGKVKFIRNEKNQGLGATRNIAVSYACGKYVALLDHDDIWRPNHLQQAVKALEEQQADLAYSTTLTFEDGTNKELGFWGPTTAELENFPLSLYSRNYITPSAVVMRKESLEKVGLMALIRACEDYDCWINLLKAGCKFLYLEEITCLYRKHPLAMTSDQKFITEKILYVMQKHQDWQIVPKAISKQRIADIYSQLGYLTASKKPWAAVKFFLYAWLQQPTNITSTKRLAKLIFLQTFRNILQPFRHQV